MSHARVHAGTCTSMGAAAASLGPQRVTEEREREELFTAVYIDCVKVVEVQQQTREAEAAFLELLRCCGVGREAWHGSGMLRLPSAAPLPRDVVAGRCVIRRFPRATRGRPCGAASGPNPSTAVCRRRSGGLSSLSLLLRSCGRGSRRRGRSRMRRVHARRLLS